jgi:hypothetical protein
MKLPLQAPAIARSASTHPISADVTQSGCNLLKCGVAIAACGAICFLSTGTACVQCLGSIGAAGCIDCF